MIVHELDLLRTVGTPDEADAELVVDADRPLSRTVVAQFVQPMARRHTQVLDGDGGVQALKPPPCRLNQIGRKALGRATFEDRPCITGFPALDHARL